MRRVRAILRIFYAGLLYFALVFGTGFVLGVIRILWATPAFGARAAELLEMPIMFAVIALAARWTMRHVAVPPVSSTRLGIGLIALGLLLVAECIGILWLRGLSIGDYVTSRDPMSGTIYMAMLGVFASMPILVARR